MTVLYSHRRPVVKVSFCLELVGHDFYVGPQVVRFGNGIVSDYRVNAFEVLFLEGYGKELRAVRALSRNAAAIILV